MVGHATRRILGIHAPVEADTKETTVKIMSVTLPLAPMVVPVTSRMDHLTAHAQMDLLEINVNWQVRVLHSLV